MGARDPVLGGLMPTSTFIHGTWDVVGTRIPYVLMFPWKKRRRINRTKAIRRNPLPE